MPPELLRPCQLIILNLKKNYLLDFSNFGKRPKNINLTCLNLRWGKILHFWKNQKRISKNKAVRHLKVNINQHTDTIKDMTEDNIQNQLTYAIKLKDNIRHPLPILLLSGQNQCWGHLSTRLLPACIPYLDFFFSQKN